MSSLNKAKSSDLCISSAAAGPAPFTACPRSSRRCSGLGASTFMLKPFPHHLLFPSGAWLPPGSALVVPVSVGPTSSLARILPVPPSQRFVAGGAQLAKVSGSVTTTCLLTDKSYWYERSLCRFPSNASVKQGFLSTFSGNRSSARLGRGVG